MFPNVAFLHVNCWSFFNIKCPWVSLVCSIHVCSNCCRYFPTLQCMVWCSVVCWYFFLTPFAIWNFESSWWSGGSLIVVIPGISIACFSLFSLIPMCAETLCSVIYFLFFGVLLGCCILIWVIFFVVFYGLHITLKVCISFVLSFVDLI